MHERDLPSSSPANSLSAFNSLRGLLHQRHVAALVADAEFIRDYANVKEKADEAKRYIREAMVQHALGRITAEQRDRILDILSFAVVAETLPDRQSHIESNLDSLTAHGAII